MLSRKEAEIYRLCHHDFDGLSTKEAAEIMGVTPRRIEQVLVKIKRKAPQLFPILTRIQAHAYSLRVNEGKTLKQIADLTDRSVTAVGNSVAVAVEKGMPAPGKRVEMKRYDSSMDGSIRRKF